MFSAANVAYVFSIYIYYTLRFITWRQFFWIFPLPSIPNKVYLGFAYLSYSSSLAPENVSDVQLTFPVDTDEDYFWVYLQYMAHQAGSSKIFADFALHLFDRMTNVNINHSSNILPV